MRIVYTFISDIETVPEYTIHSVAMARKNNPSINIDFICKEHQSFFYDYGINWVKQDSLSDGELLQEFNKVCDFKRHGKPNTTYPSTSDFWHRTSERIFYLQEYVSRNNFTNVFHLENDVIMYYPAKETLPDTDRNKVSVIMMSNTHTTFAFCHIPTASKIENLCLSFIEMLSNIGEDNLRLYGGYDHISEMSLLNLALRNNVVRSFPIMPPEPSVFIYDPGSYGQYFGGTNNGHDAGFVDTTHYIGSAIVSNMPIKPTISNNKPMVGNHRIFNLHIHSKNLKDFVV